MKAGRRLGWNARATAWAWEQQLPAPSKLVLLALAAMATNPDHGVSRVATAAAAEIAQRTGLSRRTVHNHLRHLQDIHLLVVEERVDDNDMRLANRWHLNVDGLAPVPLQVATVWREEA